MADELMLHEGRLSSLEANQRHIEAKLDVVISKLDTIHDAATRRDAYMTFGRMALGVSLKTVLWVAPLGLWLFGGKWRDLHDYLKAFAL